MRSSLQKRVTGLAVWALASVFLKHGFSQETVASAKAADGMYGKGVKTEKALPAILTSSSSSRFSGKFLWKRREGKCEVLREESIKP